MIVWILGFYLLEIDYFSIYEKLEYLRRAIVIYRDTDFQYAIRIFSPLPTYPFDGPSFSLWYEVLSYAVVHSVSSSLVKHFTS